MAEWTLTFRALRSRNYRLFVGGQSISLVGTWMTRVATSWLVYRLTDSALLLGLVGFAGLIPAFFLAPIAGVWLDRWDRHRTLVVTQVISMAQSLALALLTLTGIITVWQIIVLAFLQGLVNAVDMPARQAFVVEMVDQREDLGNAIAINSSMVHTARLVGPALAGLLIGAVGEGYCFLLDGISYTGVVISLLMMRVAPTGVAASRHRVAHELREGWRYVTGFAPVRSLLLLLVLLSVVGMPYSVLMPIFASDILHGGAHAYGIMMAASGAGALAGAMDLARRRSVLGLGRRIAVDSVLFAVALIVFGVSGNFWVSLAVLPVAGFGMMQQLASSNTIIQTVVDDDKRGRVMAFHSMAFLGTMPFGSLLAGTMGSLIGAPLTVVLGGVVCLAGSLWFARSLPKLRILVRPIYVRLGILPEVAGGLQQESSMDA